MKISTIPALLLAHVALASPLAVVKRVGDDGAITTTTTTEHVHHTTTVTTFVPDSQTPDIQDSTTVAIEGTPQPVTTLSTKTVSHSSDAVERSVPSGSPGAGGRKNIVYVTNWGIYNKVFKVADIPADSITHAMYAFANVNPDGSLFATDEWSDISIKFPGDEQIPAGNNAFGCVNQLYQLKKKNRHFKTLLSIGGWTYSIQKRFSGWSATDAGRKLFASSAVDMIANWGMDGVDIDWEYPSTPEEGRDFTLLLKEVRQALDNYAATNGQNYHYLLTVASPADPAKIANLDVAGMDQYLDSWNVMAYDYAGAWDSTTGHLANLYMDKANPTATKFNTQGALDAHIKGGVSPNKLILGLPLYGRSYASTSGIGQSYQGTARGTTEHGIYRYNDLPLPGATITEDLSLGASYSYDPAAKMLISYDTPNVVRSKGEYIHANNLGGAMFWEAAGDKTGEESLIRAMANTLGGLDTTPNMLSYPKSSFDNIRGQ